MYDALVHIFKPKKMRLVACYFLANKVNALSRDREARLRQKPTFIDESAVYAEQRSKKEKKRKKKT